MDRLQKIEHMRVLLMEMSFIFGKAEIANDYLTVPKDSEKLKAAFVDEGFTWVENIYKNEYKSAKEIRALLSEELWDRYEKWGDFEEHRESKLLHDALIKLRTVVRRKTRPNFFKKGKINAELKRIHKKGTRDSSKKNTRRHAENDGIREQTQ